MARRRHRHAPAAVEPDDSVGLAGWLYTDLLLGLAVVFLGSIAVLIPAVIDDDEATAATTTTTEVLETTTTLPVKLCTALYSPAEEERNGIYIEIPLYLRGQDLADRFLLLLQQQLDEENARPEMLDQPLKVEDLRLGLIIAKGGTAGSTGQQAGQIANSNARQLLAALSGNLPVLFTAAPARFGYSTILDADSASLEIMPLVEREC